MNTYTHVRPVSQVSSRSVSWLWPGRLALGKLALLDGDPGLGKSLLTLDLCMRRAKKELQVNFRQHKKDGRPVFYWSLPNPVADLLPPLAPLEALEPLELPFGPGLAVGVVCTWLAWPWLGPRLQPVFFDLPTLGVVVVVLSVGMLAAGSFVLS